MANNPKIERLLEEAWNQRRKGNYEDAKDLVAKAQLLSKDNDYNYLGRVFHIYAQFESDHDNYSNALNHYQQSLEFYKKAENSNKIAHSIRHIADIQRSLGNDVDSEKNYREAVRMYKANSQTKAGDMANALAGFAQILEQRNKITEAITAWEESRALYNACSLQAGVNAANRKLDSLRT